MILDQLIDRFNTLALCYSLLHELAASPIQKSLLYRAYSNECHTLLVDSTSSLPPGECLQDSQLDHGWTAGSS